MDTTRSLALAVAIALTGTLAAQAATNQSPCQRQLETAIESIATKGPFRVVEITSVNGKPSRRMTIDYESHGKLRQSIRLLAEGDELKRAREQGLAAQAASPKWMQFDDPTSIVLTYIGPDAYADSRKADGNFDRSKEIIVDYRDSMLANIEMLDFTQSANYVAQKCSTARIDFEYDLYSTIPFFTDEIKKYDYAVLDAERKASRQHDEKRQGQPLPIPTGHLELDPTTGRVSHISRSDEIPSEAQMKMTRALAAKMAPGIEVPDIKSIDIDFTFTYDPSIKIEAPK